MSFNSLAINNANWGLEGKLATLWFDNLLLGVGNNLVEKVVEEVAEKEKWNNDTFKEMKKVQISSEKILPAVSFIDESVINDEYYEIAYDILKSENEKEICSSKNYNNEMHEIRWGSFGIANAVKYWMLLNAKENCTFLPMTIEQCMLNEIFKTATDVKFSNFKNIITTMIPDISGYSWDEIIELRHHNFWLQFRKKITDLSESNRDKKLEQDIFEEIVKKDLLDMIEYFRPNVSKNIVKGIASNIPLPIPINPASIVCAGHDIMKEIDFNKKYGWIYFYLDNKRL